MLVCQASCLVKHRLGCDAVKIYCQNESAQVTPQILPAMFGSALLDTQQLHQKVPMYQLSLCPYFGIDFPPSEA
jgi:hypothetical protein